MSRTLTQQIIQFAPSALLAMSLTMALSPSPAYALYKVVGPDGKVTYTDRPETSKEGKTQSLNARGDGSAQLTLPYELRQAIQQFPVTLYTSSDCAPCNSGRQLLTQRGVPFTERSVITQDDNEALVRSLGTNELPTVTVGSQMLRGFQASEWNSYLDVAGYPKVSALPPNFPQQGRAIPLTTPKESVVVPPAPVRRAAPTPPEAAPAPAPAAPPGFRF